MKGLKLNDIAMKWAKVLANDPAVQNFCLTKYGVKPKIHVWTGGVGKEHSTYPRITIFEGKKNEGLQSPVYEYRFTMGWCIESEKEIIIDDIVIQQGGLECEELGDLSYAAIAECVPNYPVEQDEFVTTEDEMLSGLYPGWMELVIKVPVVMGATIPPYK